MLRVRKNSHERCRRFKSIKLGISESEAFHHVANRVSSGSELQSEFSFLGNAACVVGRRKLTKHLFLDRRVFLASYDPHIDLDGTILIRLLSVLLPVFSNICFNYWFSKVSPERFGAGSKLALNIQSYMSVVDSPYSDLKCGLPIEMVDGHEPMRLLCVVESTCKTMAEGLRHNALVRKFFEMDWMKLVVYSDGQFWEWSEDGFSQIEHVLRILPEVPTSRAWYDGHSSNLGFARIKQ